MVTPLLYYLKEGSIIQKIAIFVGLVGSVIGVVLWTIFIFFNPYSQPTNPATLYITLSMLCLPALGGLLLLISNKPQLMWIVFFWSLPYGLYFVGTPSIFRLYGVVLLLYLTSAVVWLIGGKTKSKRD